MKQVMVAIFDRVAEMYAHPFCCINVAVAVRMFEDACDKDGKLRDHPLDFELVHIAYWNDATGVVEPLPVGVQLARGSKKVKP